MMQTVQRLCLACSSSSFISQTELQNKNNSMCNKAGAERQKNPH